LTEVIFVIKKPNTAEIALGKSLAHYERTQKTGGAAAENIDLPYK